MALQREREAIMGVEEFFELYWPETNISGQRG